MKTTSNYIKQCSCCDKRYSRFNIPSIGIENKDELNKLMQKKLKALKLKGQIHLITSADSIVAFYYEYTRQADELHAVELCNSLYDIGCDFYERQLTKFGQCDFAIEDELI